MTAFTEAESKHSSGTEKLTKHPTTTSHRRDVEGAPASDEQLEGSEVAERSEERAKSSNSNTTERRKPDRPLPRRDDSHAD